MNIPVVFHSMFLYFIYSFATFVRPILELKLNELKVKNII